MAPLVGYCVPVAKQALDDPPALGGVVRLAHRQGRAVTIASMVELAHRPRRRPLRCSRSIGNAWRSDNRKRSRGRERVHAEYTSRTRSGYRKTRL
jgi:hypothetical protein